MSMNPLTLPLFKSLTVCPKFHSQGRHMSLVILGHPFRHGWIALSLGVLS